WPHSPDVTGSGAGVVVFLASVLVALVVLASARGLGAAAGDFVVVAGFEAAAAGREVAPGASGLGSVGAGSAVAAGSEAAPAAGAAVDAEAVTSVWIGAAA